MPAAAVIPAPVAYIKVVAVKKLVVRTRVRGRSRGPGAAAPSSIVDFGRPFAFPALSAGVDRCMSVFGGSRLCVAFALRAAGHAPLAVGGLSSKGALNRVSAAAGTFTLKKLECSERAVQACIR